ncbi:MAG: tRNA (guanosine(37)-N1)-methyltransferase TrmD [Parcubacteria group bacterium]|nr:tRNA (guanosine(37)-N1)-methyltransferase TrmD [Parcubacteria group bacterium]
MRFDFITAFPQIVDQYVHTSIIGRALTRKKITVKLHDLRKFARGTYKSIDDTPYGGGPGMVLKIEPLYRALRSALASSKISRQKTRIILLSAGGKLFTQQMAYSFVKKYERIIFICGHYEGVDARIKHFIDEEISIGEYVLTCGELPACAILDAITRLIPGVIRKESLYEESYSFQNQKSKIKNQKCAKEYPQYTRPAVFITNEKNKRRKITVPKVLLSGNHAQIKKWRAMNSAT